MQYQGRTNHLCQYLVKIKIKVLRNYHRIEETLYKVIKQLAKRVIVLVRRTLHLGIKMAMMNTTTILMAQLELLVNVFQLIQINQFHSRKQ